MHEQGEPKLRQSRHGRAQVHLRDGGKFRDPRRHEEALEATHTRAGERRELFVVPRHDAAPEAVVDQRPSGRRPGFLLQCFGGRGDRDAIERHVHDGGHPARRGRAGRGIETLPLRASRLVHVHVRIHQAGQYRGVAHVQPPSGARGSSGLTNGRDHTVGDHDRARDNTVRRRNAPTGNHQIGGGHRPVTINWPPRTSPVRGPRLWPPYLNGCAQLIRGPARPIATFLASFRGSPRGRAAGRA